MCGGSPGKLITPTFPPTCAVKHGARSVMVWTAISWNSLGPIVALHDRINSKDYLNILEDHVHPMVNPLFPDSDGIFQVDNDPIYTAHLVKNWYEGYESELELMEWSPHSLDFNIIEHFWCVLER